MSSAPAFRLYAGLGQLLRQWRGARGLSQLELALKTGISARHLSFVETGRAQPGRDVVLRLASALDLPLRDRNAALNAAGYAPIYPQGNLDSPEMAAVVHALDFMLRQQEPYPAIVIDRVCQVHRWNRAADRVLGLLLGDRCRAPWASDGLPSLLRHAACPHPMNLARLLLEPEWLRPHILHWDDLARVVLVRLRRELGGDPPGSDAARHLEHLMALPGVPAECREAQPETAAPPLVSTVFRHVPSEARDSRAQSGILLRMFTTLTTFGTPQDVTLQELRLETSFPADDGTEAFLRELALRAEA